MILLLLSLSKSYFNSMLELVNTVDFDYRINGEENLTVHTFLHFLAIPVFLAVDFFRFVASK